MHFDLKKQDDPVAAAMIAIEMTEMHLGETLRGALLEIRSVIRDAALFSAEKSIDLTILQLKAARMRIALGGAKERFGIRTSHHPAQPSPEAGAGTKGSV